MDKKDLVRKLTSRKLWLAIIEFVSMLIVAFGYSETVATQVAAIIMAGASVLAYIIAEGLTDAKAVSGQTPVIEVETIDNTVYDDLK